MKPPHKILHHGNERWVVDLREFGAGRKKFATKAEAIRHQNNAIEEQARFGQLAFDLPPETRRRFLALEAQATELGTTLEESLAWWKRSRKTFKEMTLRDAANECLASKTSAKRRDSYLEKLRLAFDEFCEWLPESKKVSDVQVDDLTRFLDNPNWQAETRRGMAARISVLFGFSVKRGWCVSNPALALDEISIHQHRPGILKVPEARALLECCTYYDPKVLASVVLGLFAGMRLSEILVMRWEQCNLDRGIIEINPKQSKTRERRLIQLQPNAIAWLRFAKENESLMPCDNWQRRLDFVRANAGWSVSVGKKWISGGKPWPRNALRHSFCSYCLPVFGELKESEWAGHSPQVALSRYRALVPESTALSFWQIFPNPPQLLALASDLSASPKPS